MAPPQSGGRDLHVPQSLLFPHVRILRLTVPPCSSHLTQHCILRLDMLDEGVTGFYVSAGLSAVCSGGATGSIPRLHRG